jgi:predicted TIM-barrel fold metal-dependent hydrolase
MCAYAFFGADRLLFGTDAPLSGPKYGLTQVTIDSIQEMTIPEAEKEKILSKNAIEMLSLAV